MVFHAHIIIIHSVVHKSLLFRNEEKLVALLVYSSFIQVATSGFRTIPYSIPVVFVFRNEEKLVGKLIYSSFIQVATSGFRTIPYSILVVFVFRNEEKLVEILFYSSFRRVATTGFRNISVVTCSWGKLSSNEEWFRNHSIFTTALQHSIPIRMIATSPD